MDVDLFMRYLGFVEERHRIWRLRQEGFTQVAGGWTKDPILASRKFTNVFRVLDPGSQYALALVDSAPTPRDALARAFLYRYTNRPATWEYLRSALGGDWPDAKDITSGLVEDLLANYRGTGQQVFSGAYIIMPEPGVPGVDKTRSVVKKTAQMLDRSWPDYEDATTQRDRLAALRRTPAVGDFMGQQVLTDMGYSLHGQYDEDEHVVLGPGSRKGLVSLGLVPTPASIVWVHSALGQHPGCPRLALPDGRLRAPSLMDVQNTLCEWSKYAREMGKVQPQPYRPAHPGPQPTPILPIHW